MIYDKKKKTEPFPPQFLFPTGKQFKCFSCFLVFTTIFLKIISPFLNFILFFWPCCTACRILVPWPGLKPSPPAVEARRLNHWTAREVPVSPFFITCWLLIMEGKDLVLLFSPSHVLKSTRLSIANVFSSSVFNISVTALSSSQAT